MSSQQEELREKVWEILNTIQANQLFVHSAFMEVPINIEEMKDSKSASLWQNDGFISKIKDYFKTSKSIMKELDDALSTKSKSKRSRRKSKKNYKRIKLPEILTVSMLNALVPNSAMLLIGGHGGGKSTLVKHLGRMFTGMRLIDTEDCIIRGHSQLTEEKMIATLNIAKLMSQGEEEVRWRTFTTSFWKILDEVNRLSPYAQNILLSMLAEGKVKYYDEVYPVDKYVLYATLNPGGVGTFDMAPPFLDRFGISVNISMPTTHDLSIILESQDDKLVGYDELIQVPAILTKEKLLSIWFQVDKIKVNQSAENFIHSIIREFTLCERIDKGNSEYLTPETGLCEGCHFNLKKLVCNKVVSILSVRVAKDLLRYSKALAWLVGFDEVTIEVIKAIAPYVIAHRVKFVERDLNQAPYWGNKAEYTADLIENAHSRFVNREKCYAIIDKFRIGEGSDEDLDYLQTFRRSDLITDVDLYPLAEALNNPAYKHIVQLTEKQYEKQNLDILIQIKNLLLKNLSFPNRGELINKIGKYTRQLTLWSREFTFERWDIVRHSIASKFEDFSQALQETTQKPCTKQMRTRDLYLEVNVNGLEPKSQVQLSCYGGAAAKDLEKELADQYPEETYDFSVELEQRASNSDKKPKIKKSSVKHANKGTKAAKKDSKKDSVHDSESDVENILDELGVD